MACGNPVRCGIALGSNLGDRLAHLQAARFAIEELHSGPSAALVSPLYETEPVECAPETPPYLNAVIEIGFAGSPRALFEELRRIELLLGRPAQRTRNASRTIDIDLLYTGSLALNDPDLVVPHPRMRLRRFVLEPLALLRPDLMLPGMDKPVRQLLELLPVRPSVTRIRANWSDSLCPNP